jgi:hypothetical protein
MKSSIHWIELLVAFGFTFCTILLLGCDQSSEITSEPDASPEAVSTNENEDVDLTDPETTSDADVEINSGDILSDLEPWPWKTDEKFAEERQALLLKLFRNSRVTLTESESVWRQGVVDGTLPWPTLHHEDRQRWLREPGPVYVYTVSLNADWLEDGLEPEPYNVPEWVDNKTFKQIAHYCPEMRSLFIQGTQVDDDGFASIADLQHLSYLCVASFFSYGYPIYITDEGMGAIGESASLKNVYIGELNITDAGIDKIAASQTIEVLRISICPITPHCFLSIQRMPSLRELKILHSDRGENSDQMSPDFSQAISEEVADAIASLNGQLTSLELRGFEVHPSVLEAVARIESLEEYVGPPLPEID